MKKRTVLFINDSLSCGSGVFRSLCQILRSLSHEKFDVTLFIYPGDGDDAAHLAAAPEGVRVMIGQGDVHPYRLPHIAALYGLSGLAKRLHLAGLSKTLNARTRSAVRRQKNKATAKKFFRDQSFDVLIANTVPNCSEIAHFIGAKKKYAVFHSSRAEFFPEATKAALERFDGMVAVSEGVGRVLKEAYPAYANKVQTITNYVDGDEIRKKASAYEVPPHDGLPSLCTCGRLSREKGFDLAVEAAKLLKDKGYDFIWYFVGEGPEREKLTEMIREKSLENMLLLIGYQQNPYPYIGACDIYVQPSYEEAQPLSVMEAQALGRAIVSTRTVGGRTILKDGVCGILTPMTAEGLAQGIEALLKDPDARAAFARRFTIADEARNKEEFTAAWDRLLSE